MPELDDAIANAERAVERLRGDMATVQARFVAATSAQLGDTITEMVEETVRREHEHSQKIGVEGLRRLKADLAELLARVPVLTAESVGFKKLVDSPFSAGTGSDPLFSAGQPPS